MDWGQLAAPLIGAGVGLLGSQDQDVTQKVDYLPGQKDLLSSYLQDARNLYLQGPQQYYPGQTVANLNPLTVAGQNWMIGQTPKQEQIADMAGSNFIDLSLGGAPRIGGFQLAPQVGFGIDQGLQDAISNPIYRQLAERILPATDLAATSQGAFGGTRHQQLRDQAGVDATERMAEQTALANLQARQQSIGQRAGDISALLSGRGQDIGQNQMYNQNLQAAINAAPGIMQNFLSPGATMQAIGSDRQGYEQSLLNADFSRWMYGQQAPYDAISRLGTYLGQVQPSGSTMTQQGVQGSPANIFGGALAGLQFYNMLNQQPSYPTAQYNQSFSPGYYPPQSLLPQMGG